MCIVSIDPPGCKDITADSLTITSIIDGDTTVTGGSLAAGAVAVGAVVGVAISEADNTATLNLSQSDMDIAAVD